MDLLPLLPAKGPLAEARAETFADLAAEATQTAAQREEVLNKDPGDLAARAYEILREESHQGAAQVVHVGDPDSRLINYFTGTLAVYFQVVALAREADKTTREALADQARRLREDADDAKLGAIWLRAVRGADTAEDMLHVLEAADPEAPPQL